MLQTMMRKAPEERRRCEFMYAVMWEFEYKTLPTSLVLKPAPLALLRLLPQKGSGASIAAPADVDRAAHSHVEVSRH